MRRLYPLPVIGKMWGNGHALAMMQ